MHSRILTEKFIFVDSPMRSIETAGRGETVIQYASKTDLIALTLWSTFLVYYT